MDINILINNGVDVNHGLELLGDMETYNSIIEDFLSEFDNRMQRIDNYKTNNDMENYSIEVHSLKSDSKYLGFMKLADISYQHELASKAGDVATVNNTYNDLVSEANRIISVVKQYLNKEEATPVVHEENTMDQNKKTILIADDSSIIREFVKEIFSEQYNVKAASTGREVADIIREDPNNVAVLLLDLNMPDINGFQVLEWFKENDLFRLIPVSVITGANDKESIDKAFSYPIVDMLNKPFEKETVKDIVEKTIEYRNV